MKFETGLLGSHFVLEKGISYKGNELVETSEVGLVTLDSFRPGGGYKTGSEKPYDGGYKQSFVLSPGDVVIATTDVTQDGAVLCAPALVPNYEESFSELVWSLDVAKLLPITGDVRPEYVYNFLRVPLNRKRAAYGDTGTTVRRIPFDAMYEQIIPVPSLEEQDRINAFIAVLDRKIELNTAMATTLEQIAHSLFRSWFVDFEPVKAKMAGEKPVGMDEVTAALFPQSMQDSELGPIPQGWEITEIRSFGRVVTGKTPSTKNEVYWGDEIPFVTIPDMHGQGLIINTKRRLSRKGADSQKNQYLPEGSTLVSCIATPGLVAYATEVCQSNQQINSVIPNGEHPSIWLFWHLRNMIPAFINHSGIGTVFPNLNKSDFSDIKSVVPTEELRLAFASSVSPMFRKIDVLRREVHTLESARDSVLPCLISGELQIPKEMLAL